MKTDQRTGITKLQVELPADQAANGYPLYLTVRRLGDTENYGGEFMVDLEKPGLHVDVFSPAEIKWIGEQLANFRLSV